MTSQSNRNNVVLTDLLRLGLPIAASALNRKLVRLRNRFMPSPQAPAAAQGDLDAIRETMFSYWKNLGHNEKTCAYFFRDALNTAEHGLSVKLAKATWGDLANKKILDMGCGWGGLSVALAQEGADVTSVDVVPEHVAVTARRLSSSKAYVADATDLSTISAKLDAPFDFVFLHSVIEHVGNEPDYRGKATPFLPAKESVVTEAAKLVREGGGLYLSTGNFNFPLDGEIKTWFFHWLPKRTQRETLAEMGIGADNYGLLTWDELDHTTRQNNLSLQHVYTGENSRFKLLLYVLSYCSRHISLDASLPRGTIEAMVELMDNDPNYMSDWHAFFAKDAA